MFMPIRLLHPLLLHLKHTGSRKDPSAVRTNTRARTQRKKRLHWAQSHLIWKSLEYTHTRAHAHKPTPTCGEIQQLPPSFFFSLAPITLATVIFHPLIRSYLLPPLTFHR